MLFCKDRHPETQQKHYWWMNRNQQHRKVLSPQHPLPPPITTQYNLQTKKKVHGPTHTLTRSHTFVLTRAHTRSRSLATLELASSDNVSLPLSQAPDRACTQRNEKSCSHAHKHTGALSSMCTCTPRGDNIG